MRKYRTQADLPAEKQGKGRNRELIALNSGQFSVLFVMSGSHIFVNGFFEFLNRCKMVLSGLCRALCVNQISLPQ